MLPCYLLLDMCAVLMLRDPYFIVGPEHHAMGAPLSPGLAHMHPALLSLLRTALPLAGIIAALRLMLGLGAVCLYLFLSPLLGFRAHPWHLPSTYGSFTQVLDRGLAGWWGAWWHQTFRFGFEAPARWLIARMRERKRQWRGQDQSGEGRGDHGDEKGHGGRTGNSSTPSERLVLAFCAFLQSGFLHAAGSYSTVPPSKWWMPPLFFALAGLGTNLQHWLARALQPQVRTLPLSLFFTYPHFSFPGVIPVPSKRMHIHTILLLLTRLPRAHVD